LRIDWLCSLRWVIQKPLTVACRPDWLLPLELSLETLGFFLQGRGDRIVDRGGEHADRERHENRRRD